MLAELLIIIMSYNETSVLNSTLTYNSSSSATIRRVSPEEYVTLAVFVLSTITLIIGISSWIFIKKFRHFKNYLFLNIIFNNIVNIVLSYDVINVLKNKSEAIIFTHALSFLYFKLSAHYWLLLLCYVFYVELVKVLGGDVERKYLKSNLLAWGVPLFFTVFCVFVVPSIHISKTTNATMYHWILFSPLLINVLIYIRVFCALLKIDVRNSSDWCCRVYVATVIFLISGVLFLLLPLRLYVDFPPYLSTVVVYLQPVVINVYFFIIRLNRTAWKEYYDRRLKY